ncbi:MAG: hypothetical protein ABIQ27_00205 [Flavobacterium sp.]|uniref:hypothetical protein n=1 Tax=Flavobacterium sp. TaxID=239 RepID=UPI0032637ABC
MNIKIKLLARLFLLMLFLTLTSCEKDLYEEPLKKEIPKFSVEMKEVTNKSEVISKLRKKFPTKLTTSPYARGEGTLLTLQGDFGKVKLDNVLQVAKDNDIAYSFEIDETIKSPNVYLNLVIDKNDVIWLYKVDKIVQHYQDYPINSERLVRYKLNPDLTEQSSTPCDTIIFPPFQPDPTGSNTTSGGGSTGNWQNTPPSGGFFPPFIFTPPGGSSSGDDSTSGGGIANVVSAIASAVGDAWNWLIELFHSPPCGCHKYSNVVIVDVPESPCGEGGTISIIPQSPVLDKIYELNELLGNRLKYEDKNYFYYTDGRYLDYFLDLAQNPPVNYAYYDILPDLITQVRTTGDYDFVEQTNTTIIGNPIFYTSAKPFIIEKQINGNQLDPCAQGVLTQVKNSTVCDIAQVIAKIGPSISVYNTTIKSEVAPNGKPAQTVHNSTYNYTIYISTDYTGKTKLFIAASMFHELIHAYFMSLFDDYYNTSPPNLSAYNDFAGLFHYYVTLHHPSSINPADVHHQQMATDYVDAIARALQEYQTGLPVPSTSSPEQIYSDMAWGGLSEAPLFNTLFPEGSPDRQRILNRYAAEQTGHSIGEGTPQAQTQIGQPCN